MLKSQIRWGSPKGLLFEPFFLLWFTCSGNVQRSWLSITALNPHHGFNDVPCFYSFMCGISSSNQSLVCLPRSQLNTSTISASLLEVSMGATKRAEISRNYLLMNLRFHLCQKYDFAHSSMFPTVEAFVVVSVPAALSLLEDKIRQG